MTIKNKITIGMIGVLLFPGCELADKVKKNIWGEKAEAGMDYIKVKSFEDINALFPKSVVEIEKQTDKVILETDLALKAIIDIKDEDRNFDNTARALDIISSNFSNKISSISILEMVSTDKGIRDASQKAVIKAQQFAVDAFNNVELYKAFKGYVEGNSKKESLNKEQQYFLEEEMKGFVRSGLDLPEAQLDEVKKLQKEIAGLSVKFEANINQDKSSIAVTREQLEGTAEDFINHLKKDKSGNYILYCDYPTVAEVMGNCKVESTRKGLSQIFNNRAYPDNVEILEKVIVLRDQLAKKLSFSSFSDLSIDPEMAKTTKRAESFITDLIGKVKGKAEKELEELMSDLPEGVSLVDGKLQPWDIKYIKEQYKKKHFNIDERKIAEYFPMEATIDALFSIYQKFLNLTFKLSKPAWSWHEEVSLIEVYSNEDNKLIGYIFLDLYPRENKFSHACHACFVQRMADRPDAAVLIANFPKSTKDKPSLLKHSDVETFFHEFGHAMHGVLGNTELASFAGTNTKQDFVEMPSQMFEEWMWDKEILKQVSGHYKTGESIPEELLDKMIDLKKFDSGYFVLRQCGLSLLALDYFKEGAKKDTTQILHDLHTKHFKYINLDPKNHMQASFGHLMVYNSRYYGYMWSRVFALDMFDTVKEMGLLNPKSGAKLVSEVIGKGGSVDPDELLRTFLGREPREDAFLREYGFIKS